MSDCLPPEALTNILGRLPAKPLIRFTCVCKSWLSLICNFASARATAKHPFLLLHFSLPQNNAVLLCLRSDAHAVYAHGMLVFTKPGQEPSVEFLRKERERRLMLHWNRMGILGEEETKKLEEEDYQRERRLLDRLLEKKQAFDSTPPPPPFSSPKLPTMDQILTEIEELPATFDKHFEGFDVGDIPGYAFVPVRPFVLDCRESMERIEGYAKFALDDYNKCNNTKYQIVKALKANIGSGFPGWTYYITFQVKDMAGYGSPTLNFQAIVETFQGQETVKFITPEL
ncbi:hypothetical protein RHMOL_Rhmol05G0254800 [Rhododendron molle]|uniref:Uncharacterized protein n=1 Tax=Rhododendron molle TaxID=49168 RepID=A0ACC0NUI8_RHOML|nr:hypothetical protein RHMOL_Rhmol05G0254800 [Rhododendron molle]